MGERMLGYRKRTFFCVLEHPQKLHTGKQLDTVNKINCKEEYPNMEYADIERLNRIIIPAIATYVYNTDKKSVKNTILPSVVDTLTDKGLIKYLSKLMISDDESTNIEIMKWVGKYPDLSQSREYCVLNAINEDEAIGIIQKTDFQTKCIDYYSNNENNNFSEMTNNERKRLRETLKERLKKKHTPLKSEIAKTMTLNYVAFNINGIDILNMVNEDKKLYEMIANFYRDTNNEFEETLSMFRKHKVAFEPDLKIRKKKRLNGQ